MLSRKLTPFFRAAVPALFLGTSLASHAALTVTFDNPNDLSDHFTNTSVTPVALSSTGGIGGSGSVNLTSIGGGDAQYLTLKTPFAGNLSSWSVSVLAYNGAAALAPISYLGVTSGPVSSLEGSPSADGSTIAPFLSFSSGDADGGSISSSSFIGGSGTSDDHTTEMFTNLTASTWYRHDFSVSYLGSNIYSLTASIYEVDANGANPVLRGTTGAHQFTNAVLAADPSVYLFLGVYQGAALDNFSTTAVPETSSLALAFGGCTLTLRRRRAR